MDPQPIDDEALGRFTWDRENGFWLGSFEVSPETSAWLTVDVGPSGRPGVLALAREAVARVRELEPEARDFLAGELRKARPPGTSEGRPGDVETAVGRLGLKSVSAQPDGVLELVYGDEDLFGGAEFFVWFDGDGGRGIIVLHEGETSDEEGSA